MYMTVLLGSYANVLSCEHEPCIKTQALGILHTRTIVYTSCTYGIVKSHVCTRQRWRAGRITTIRMRSVRRLSHKYKRI